MDYRQLRLERIKALIEQRFSKSKKDFADSVDIPPSSVSRWLLGGSSWKQGCGEKHARQIETNLRLPPGYLVMPELDLKAPVPEVEKPWPFKTVKRKRYDDLSKEGKQQVEGALRTAIADIEQSESSAGTKSGKRPAI